jgi:hypothetical protein
MSPRDVVSLAAMLGLKAIALTDHDTMSGLQEAGEAGELLGVTIVPGIEISCDYQGREVHLLGYFLDPEAEKLREYEAWVKESRRNRNQKILEKLQKKGFDISLETLEQKHPDATLGRPHIAQELVELGAVQNVKEAFRRYLDTGRSCYAPREMPSLADGAKLLRACGGVAVLAHPLQYGFPKSDLEKFVKAAAEAGVTGLEIYYTGYTENDRNKLFDLAEKHSLLPTGGSDFHGDNKPGIQLGSGDGALSVPAYMLAMLAMSQYR